MVKLVISWWGGHNDSKKIDDTYKGMLKGKRILYIPRAMYPEKYASCYEWIQNIFPINEWYNIDCLSEKEYLEHEKKYNISYDGIYLWWGNTYRLLKLVKETWFSQVIKQFLEENKPIYWGSAWAIIMGNGINTAADMNVVKLSLDETKGFNVCKWYSLVCHCDDKESDEIIDYVQHYQIPVIALPEWTWLIYDNDIYSIQWEKSAYLFSVSWEKIELKIGDIL